MAYFSNGTEGEMYEAQFCDRCVHGQDDNNPCRVMLAHTLYNYDQFPEHANTDEKRGQATATRAILELLIPTEGLYAADCQMFILDKRVEFEQQAIGTLPGLRGEMMDSGNYERSLIGYLAYALAVEVERIARTLHPNQLQWPLHKAIYKRIVRDARKGVSILDSIADMDPWLESDVNGIMPRKYIGFAREVACESETQVQFCIDQITEAASKRQLNDALTRCKKVVESDQEYADILRQVETILTPIFKKVIK